jgi:hypothetical protein
MLQKRNIHKKRKKGGGEAQNTCSQTHTTQTYIGGKGKGLDGTGSMLYRRSVQRSSPDVSRKIEGTK